MSRQPFQVLAAQQFQPGGEPPTEIELLQVGDWYVPWKGHLVNTVDDFNEMVANFQNGAGKFQPDNKLPINIDHYKEQAVGWIYGLEVRGNSLWGTNIEWTPEGKQLIADKSFSYLSSEWSPIWENPLNEGELTDNVFTGACVTNYPLFPELQPLMASHKQKKDLTRSAETFTLYMKGSVMKLEDLLAKDADKLSDDEKKFIVDHKADLDEDQVKTLTEAGVLEADAPEEPETPEEPGEPETPEEPETPPAEASKLKKGERAISASKLRKLEADAQRGVEADKKIQKMEATKEAEGMTISASNKDGQFAPAQTGKVSEFLLTLNASQKKSFKDLIASLPKIPLGQRVSAPEEGEGSGPTAVLAKKIAEKMEATAKDGNAMTHMEARKAILESDKSLAAQVKDAEEEERQ